LNDLSTMTFAEDNLIRLKRLANYVALSQCLTRAERETKTKQMEITTNPCAKEGVFLIKTDQQTERFKPCH